MKTKVELDCGGAIYVLPKRSCPNCDQRLALADAAKDEYEGAKLYVCTQCERGWGANKEGEEMVENWRTRTGLKTLGMDVAFPY